jgi:exonuclease V
MRLTSPRSLFTASPLRARMSSSDYGSEPEWTDPTVEGQLRQVEATSPSRTRQAPARIEVAVEGLAVPSTSRLSASPTRRASSTGATAPVRSPWCVPSPRPSLVPSSSQLERLREKYRKHRGWGGLSVSDLVGPSWCEVSPPHPYLLPKSPTNARPLHRSNTLTASIPRPTSLPLSVLSA